MVFCILLCTFFYTDALYAYIYSQILGRKYSIKITMIGTLVLWTSDVLLKLVPQYILGAEEIGFLNLIMLVTAFLYEQLLFHGSIIKKLFALCLVPIALGGMDWLTMNLTFQLLGNTDINDPVVVLTSALCSVIPFMLGAVLFVWLWKTMESRNYQVESKQWIGLLMPLSHMVIFYYISIEWIDTPLRFKALVMIGLFMMFIGDVFLFLLFDRMNAKKQAEAEVQRLRYEYEREKLRFEEIKENQIEMAKIRHDFQNYLTVIKNME